MIKCFMKDLLGWMQGEYLETRDIAEVLDFAGRFGANLEPVEVRQSELCEVTTPDGLRITVVNDWPDDRGII